MKRDEVRQLSLDELKKRLVDEEENLGNLRFQLATSQLESPIKVRTVRRDIARLKTAIREKELQAATTQAPKPQAAKEPQAGQPANTEVKTS